MQPPSCMKTRQRKRLRCVAPSCQLQECSAHQPTQLAIAKIDHTNSLTQFHTPALLTPEVLTSNNKNKYCHCHCHTIECWVNGQGPWKFLSDSIKCSRKMCLSCRCSCQKFIFGQKAWIIRTGHGPSLTVVLGRMEVTVQKAHASKQTDIQNLPHHYHYHWSIGHWSIIIHNPPVPRLPNLQNDPKCEFNLTQLQSIDKVIWTCEHFYDMVFPNCILMYPGSWLLADFLIFGLLLLLNYCQIQRNQHPWKAIQVADFVLNWFAAKHHVRSRRKETSSLGWLIWMDLLHSAELLLCKGQKAIHDGIRSG